MEVTPVTESKQKFNKREYNKLYLQQNKESIMKSHEIANMKDTILMRNTAPKVLNVLNY